MTKDNITMLTTINRNVNLLSCNVDGETVLLDSDAGFYFGLNPIASRIWDIIETPRTVADICSQLQNDYEVERELCETEVLGFLTELLDRKIVSYETN